MRSGRGSALASRAIIAHTANEKTLAGPSRRRCRLGGADVTRARVIREHRDATMPRAAGWLRRLQARYADRWRAAIDAAIARSRAASIACLTAVQSRAGTYT